MIRPLFKVHEPFMEVPKGHGYLGVIQYDDEEDKIQCHICGKWVKAIANHSRMTHKINSQEYREKFSLPLRGGLMVKSSSKKYSDRAMTDDNINRLKRMRAKWNRKKTDKQEIKRLNTYRSRRVYAAKNRLASKNRVGLCPAQMQARFDIVRMIVKRNPANMDIMKYDKKLYDAMIRFGSVDKWRKTHGIELFPKKKQKIYQNLDMIAAIRKCAHELGHDPSIQDYEKTYNKPSASTIRRVFGSWSTAICTAGLK